VLKRQDGQMTQKRCLLSQVLSVVLLVLLTRRPRTDIYGLVLDDRRRVVAKSQTAKDVETNAEPETFIQMPLPGNTD